jgi:hypothetical protein
MPVDGAARGKMGLRHIPDRSLVCHTTVSFNVSFWHSTDMTNLFGDAAFVGKADMALASQNVSF